MTPAKNAPLHLNLFDTSSLPADLAKLIGGATSVTEILDGLPTLLKKYKNGGLHSLGKIDDGAQIHGDVYIGKGTHIHSGVVIEGPAYIGENVSVRPHALIRGGSYVANDCVIGHGADIKSSLLLPGAKIQDGTFAGESILGSGARVGSGTILANRKFNQRTILTDWGTGPTATNREFFGAVIGDQVRLGANVTCSPGAVVGAFTWVGSGVVVHGCLPPDHLVTTKQELEIKPKSRIPLTSGKGTYENL